MSRSVKEQVMTGLRFGGSLAVFFIAMAPLVDGWRRVVWAAPPHQLVWSPIGWVELIVAAALLGRRLDTGARLDADFCGKGKDNRHA